MTDTLAKLRDKLGINFPAKESGEAAAKHWKIFRYERTVDIADHFDFGARWGWEKGVSAEQSRSKKLLEEIVKLGASPMHMYPGDLQRWADETIAQYDASAEGRVGEK